MRLNLLSEYNISLYSRVTRAEIRLLSWYTYYTNIIIIIAIW